MKYKLIELGLWMLSVIPIVMVTKDTNGVSKYKSEVIHIAGTLIAWAIISIIVAITATIFITHDLKKDFQYMKKGLERIERRITSFHGE